MKFVFLPVSENGENGLGDKGADATMPLQNFWARTAPGQNAAVVEQGSHSISQSAPRLLSFQCQTKQNDRRLLSLLRARLVCHIKSLKEMMEVDRWYHLSRPGWFSVKVIAGDWLKLSTVLLASSPRINISSTGSTHQTHQIILSRTHKRVKRNHTALSRAEASTATWRIP